MIRSDIVFARVIMHIGPEFGDRRAHMGHTSCLIAEFLRRIFAVHFRHYSDIVVERGVIAQQSEFGVANHQRPCAIAVVDRIISLTGSHVVSDLPICGFVFRNRFDELMRGAYSDSISLETWFRPEGQQVVEVYDGTTPARVVPDKQIP